MIHVCKSLRSLVLFLPIAALGCGESGTVTEKMPEGGTFPVKGKVFLAEGKPLSKGRVIFMPATQPGLQAIGEVGSDGAFVLTSRSEGDGAMAGDYRVKVVTPLAPQFKHYEKYANEDLTPLKATVKNSPNELPPFELK